MPLFLAVVLAAAGLFLASGLAVLAADIDPRLAHVRV